MPSCPSCREENGERARLLQLRGAPPSLAETDELLARATAKSS